ncbi:aldehyde dehydrogenase, conserved site-containing protein [Tanacetum coccineum]
MSPGNVSPSSLSARPIPGDKSSEKPIPSDKSPGIPRICRSGKWQMSRGYFVYLDLEFFPSSQTTDEVAYDEIAWLMPVWDPSYEDAFDKDSWDEDSCDEDSYSKNVFVEDACDEGAFDLSTFEERLVQLNIFVWKERGGSTVRIHGGDYEMTIVIKTVNDKYYYTVHSTDSFESVISMIEKYLKLSPGCYKLIFRHPRKKYGNVWVKTDRDWYFVVLFSSFRGYLVYLDLEVFPSSQTAGLSIQPDC